MDIPRAHARTLEHTLSVGRVFEPIKLEPPGDPRLVKDVERCVDDLSPAALALLAAVRSTLQLSRSSYRYGSGVTCKQIAATLQRPNGSLWRHDRNLLKMLVEVGLVRVKRQPKPAKTWRGVDGQVMRLGAGFEHVYSIPERVLYALVLIDNPDAFKPSPVSSADEVASIPAARVSVRRWWGLTGLQVAALLALALALVGVLLLMIVLVSPG